MSPSVKWCGRMSNTGTAHALGPSAIVGRQLPAKCLPTVCQVPATGRLQPYGLVPHHFVGLLFAKCTKWGSLVRKNVHLLTGLLASLLVAKARGSSRVADLGSRGTCLKPSVHLHCSNFALLRSTSRKPRPASLVHAMQLISPQSITCITSATARIG